MLTYQETIIRTEVQEKILEVPREWSMYTKKGDESITKKAQKLFDSIVNKENPEKSFAQFFKSWNRMSYSKTMGEASDTAVRECVWDFAEKVAKAINFDVENLKFIWYSR